MEYTQTIFGKKIKTKKEQEYTKKISAPIYTPKNNKPHLSELLDVSKYKKMVKKINASKLPDNEKKFLKWSAGRLVVFNYDIIADYYSHSDKEMQELMEDLALVIIDFKKAIQLGYVKINEELAKEYLKDFPDEK